MTQNMDHALDEFFDFSSASIDHIPTLTQTSVPEPLLSGIPSSDNENYLPPEIYQTFGFFQEEPGAKLDYSNFTKWIPRFSRPDQSCAYCKARHLECWFTYEGQEDCSACKALFRPCSFTAEQHPEVMMDTLHTVFEDTIQSCGAMTGAKALRSFDRTPMDRPHNFDDDRSSKRSGTRFSRNITSVLKKWMEQHRDNPYPTEEQKEELAELTSLSVGQISNWFANHRRRTRQRARGVSPSLRSPTWPNSPSESIPIPSNKRGLVFEGKTWEIMNPMDRWRASPPENEPATVHAIADAVANTHETDSRDTSLSRKNSHTNILSSASSGQRAPSVTSLETGRSESQLSSGSFSNHSLASSLSLGSRGSGLRKDRKRRRRTASAANPMPAQHRPFQCTFCTDTFRTKHDWTRHEKSLHLNLEKWICCPLGPVITCPNTGELVCVFCGEVNPSTEHLEQHDFEKCEGSVASRTFYRKDHLRQHLRLVHSCKMIDSMESWKSESTFIKSKCGFCNERFESWSARNDHLAKHFRSGSTMKDWKGCRGLEPEVAKLVTNAMPSYMIGDESKTPNPFSAGNPSYSEFVRVKVSPHSSISPGPNNVEMEGYGQGMEMNFPFEMEMEPSTVGNPQGCSFDLEDIGVDLNSPLVPKVSTCWQILTMTLGHYVQECLAAQVPITDDMLQQKARVALYGSDDEWNQTAADNPEWLELFKKAHGLPSTATDLNVDMMEDLGIGIEDLNFDALILDSSWDALI